MSEYIRETFYKDDDGECVVELADDILFAHVTIRNFSPSVMKRVKSVWAYLKYTAYMSGFDAILTYNANKKFCEKMDPEYRTLFNFTHEGQEREVLIWELK